MKEFKKKNSACPNKTQCALREGGLLSRLTGVSQHLRNFECGWTYRRGCKGATITGVTGLLTNSVDYNGAKPIHTVQSSPQLVSRTVPSV
jgi:hypothetical protein